MNELKYINEKLKGNNDYAMFYFTDKKEIVEMMDFIANDFLYKKWSTKNGSVVLTQPKVEDGSNFTFEDVQHFVYDNLHIFSVQLFNRREPNEDSFAFLFAMQKYLLEKEGKFEDLED